MGESTADIFKGTPGVLSGSNRNGASINPNIRGLQGMNRVATSIDGRNRRRQPTAAITASTIVPTSIPI